MREKDVNLPCRIFAILVMLFLLAPLVVIVIYLLIFAFFALIIVNLLLKAWVDKRGGSAE